MGIWLPTIIVCVFGATLQGQSGTPPVAPTPPTAPAPPTMPGGPLAPIVQQRLQNLNQPLNAAGATNAPAPMLTNQISGGVQNQAFSEADKVLLLYKVGIH